MRYREQASFEQIRDINCVIDGDNCILSWLWPRGIDSVYICRTAEDEKIDIDKVTKENSKLYTKNEYMEYNGYHERIEGIGRYTYTLYPMVREDGELYLIDQDGINNKISVRTGKIHIVYSVKERKKLFTDKKTVRITVCPEAPVDKDAICYVKKSGSYPQNSSDGIVFPFIQDFTAGENIMPEIEMDKNEYVRLFLTDSSINVGLYELIGR
ncbi:hypothetical protein OXPF_27530 [Oxobacter pfennigii]|uniref:Beta-mannanase n=1 Tax=Oxobacter pfennigii TaxID=36849 RepID=A0A0N8NSY3_9CLOT|nr:hypothetical protein [Oxobacter pfennigii]KPU43312.1 hypothetical protein OXPF_27530 [Oxobacter pfennigii]